jgi:hypothetical protein
MTMTVSVAAARLKRELDQAHTKIDEALACVTALFASAAQARGAHIGHEALLRMHKSAGNLLTLRADLIRVHGVLKDDFQVVSGAEEPTCPDSKDFFITGQAAA